MRHLKNKRFIILILFICVVSVFYFIFDLKFNEKIQSAGWLQNYNYRKEITINGSTVGAQTDYQMKITVYKGTGTDSGNSVYLNNHVKNNFSDIAFTTSDGTTKLNYWIESYVSGNLAVVWVKFNSIPISPSTAKFYIYYGNDLAVSESNGENTFIAFDDFEGTFSSWTLARYHEAYGSSDTVVSPYDNSTAIRVAITSGVDGSCNSATQNKTFIFGGTNNTSNLYADVYGSGSGVSSAYLFEAIYLTPYYSGDPEQYHSFCFFQGSGYPYCSTSGWHWLTNNTLNTIALNDYWPNANIDQIKVQLVIGGCYPASNGTLINDAFKIYKKVSPAPAFGSWGDEEVFEENPIPGDGFNTILKPYPYPDFTVSSSRLNLGVEIEFIDNSKCYKWEDSFLTEYDCKTNQDVVYKWNFNSNEDSNIDCDSSDGIYGYRCRGNATTSYNSIGTKAVTLEITDDSGSCASTEEISVSLKLPEWKEVKPF